MSDDERMFKADAVFKGIRAMDMRYEGIHLLGDYMHQAQNLVNSAAATQVESKKLLVGAVVVAREGVASFKIAEDGLRTVAEEIVDDFASCAKTVSFNLNNAVELMRESGKELQEQSNLSMQEHAKGINEAVARLEQASQAAEANRLAAMDARMKLFDYHNELKMHEASIFAAIKSATEAASRRTFFERVGDVFWPTRVTLNFPKPPARPQFRNSEI